MFTVNPKTLAMLMAKRWPGCWPFVAALLGEEGLTVPKDVEALMLDPKALGAFVASPRPGDLALARGDKGVHVGLVISAGPTGRVAHAGKDQCGRVDLLEVFVRGHRQCRFVRLARKGR